MIRRFSSLSSLLITIITCSLFIISLFLLSYRTTHAFTISKFNTVSNLGLVGYWTLDNKDMLQGVARDSSGNGNSGFRSGISTTTFYTAGKIGEAGDFDGINDYIFANASPVTAYPFTLSAWVYGEGDGLTTNAAFGLESSGAANFKFYFIGLGGAGVANFSTRPTVANRVTVAGTKGLLNGWHMITGVMTTSDTMLLYVDGILEGQGTQANSFAATDQVGIGALVDSAPDSFFNGKIDDARVYSRALSAAEILALYQQKAGTKRGVSTNTIKDASLVGWWTFDGKDIVNGAVQDKSGNANTVNLFNTASSTFFNEGKIGQGANFDGGNDYAKTTGNFSIGSNIATVCYWQNLPTYSNTDLITMELSSNFNSFGNTFVIDPNGVAGAYSVMIHGTSGYRGESFTRPSVNTWHNYCIVLDNSTTLGDITVYVDGTVQSTTLTNNNKTLPGVFDTYPLHFMARGGSSLFQKGILDDVRIYNRTLTASEVTGIYQSGVSKINASQNTLTTGLVGAWTFDGKDMPNGHVNDVSGNGNTGYMINVATSTFRTEGKIGQGANFDGVDDYIAPSSFNFLSGYPLTMSAWVKTNNTANQGILFAGQSNSSQRYVALLVHSSAFAFSTRNDTGESPRISTIAPDGKWHHLVGVINADNSKVFYIDGVVAPLSTNGSSVSAPTMNSLNIGKVGGSSSGRNFDGFIDDPRVYTRALSAAEVQQLYLTGK